MSLAADLIAPAAIPQLTAHSRLLPADHEFSTQNLLELVPATGGLAWVRDGEGIVGWGEAARLVVRGRERFSRAQRWWSDTIKASTCADEVKLAGSGLVAFASFGFEPGRSVLVIPQVVIGRRGGQTWYTVIRNSDDQFDEPSLLLSRRDPALPPGEMRWEEGTQPTQKWQRAVTEAVDRINRGEVDKVVLARDIVGFSSKPIDTRNVLTRISAAYPECWSFAVDGLIGATPELLVRRRGLQVTSRVLAGTVRRGQDKTADANLAEELMASDKERAEHEYAVESVAQALSAHCTDLQVPDAPRLLRLANVQHLETDISGELADNAPMLALAASLHPTAAVCGTPTERAANLIRAIEGMDRGRYAGPIGWLDSNNDGDLGIALRCGELDSDDPRRIRLFAGCGIVAGSDAASELAETQAKLEPMMSALSN